MNHPIECPRCGGDGRIEGEGQTRWGLYTTFIECPTCKGEGIVTPDPVAVEDGEGE